jgi:hypothetical protein
METFVVRLWVASSPDEPVDDLRGTVQRVSSGQEERFHDADQLIAIMSRRTAEEGVGHDRAFSD